MRGGPTKHITSLSEVSQDLEDSVWASQIEDEQAPVTFLHQPDDMVQAFSAREVVGWDFGRLLEYCEVHFPALHWQKGFLTKEGTA